MDLKGSYSTIRMYALYKNTRDIYIYNLLQAFIGYIYIFQTFHYSKLCYRIFRTFSIKTFNF